MRIIAITILSTYFLFAQSTKINTSQLTSSQIGVLVSILGKIQVATVDPSLRIDTSVSPPVIRAVGSSSRTEIYKPTSNTVTLTLTPTSNIQVFQNGLCVDETDDYTISGRIITFVNFTPGDKIKVIY